jgi:hypothetical protein
MVPKEIRGRLQNTTRGEYKDNLSYGSIGKIFKSLCTYIQYRIKDITPCPNQGRNREFGRPQIHNFSKETNRNQNKNST